MVKTKNKVENLDDELSKEMDDIDEVEEEEEQLPPEETTVDEEENGLMEDLMVRYDFFKKAIESLQNLVRKLWGIVKEDRSRIKKLEEDFKFLIEAK